MVASSRKGRETPLLGSHSIMPLNYALHQMLFWGISFPLEYFFFEVSHPNQKFSEVIDPLKVSQHIYQLRNL